MIARVCLVASAAALAMLPLPADRVERMYSTGFYPRLQRVVTPLTNLVPIALFDVAALALVGACVWVFTVRLRRSGMRAVLGRGLVSLATLAAGVYLVFLLMWGFNYRRVPLEAKLDYEGTRITSASAIAFAAGAVTRVNALRGQAVAMSDDERALAAAFADAHRALGGPGHVAVGQPKLSLLGLYFRQAAIDGMTVPFFLEVIVNPDLLAVERPFVLAHEWAHLAGYADESEANFVAWLTCTRGSPLAQYSGWLAAYQHARSPLSREERQRLPPLDEGVRADLQAIALRYGRSSQVVRTAARDVYDSYLKANRVSEGIASYDAVLRLMLGTTFDERGNPRLKAP